LVRASAKTMSLRHGLAPLGLLTLLVTAHAHAQFLCPTAKTNPDESLSRWLRPKPAVQVAFNDSVYKTCFRRITDDNALPTNGETHNSVPVSSQIQAWNADQTKLFLASGYIVESPSWVVYKYLPLLGTVNFRWSPTDPNVGYFASGSEFFRIDVTSGPIGEVIPLRTFSEYAAGLEVVNERADLSNDGRLVVLEGYRHTGQTDTLNLYVTTVQGDSHLTSQSGFQSVDVGSHVFGPGIPEGAFVASKIGPSQIDLSANCLASGTILAHFGNSEVFVYDVVSNRKGTTRPVYTGGDCGSLKDMRMAPSGSYALLNWRGGGASGPCGLQAYDTAMVYLGHVCPGRSGYDLTVDDAGVEWCVAFDSTFAGTGPSITKYRLPRGLDEWNAGDETAAGSLVPLSVQLGSMQLSGRALGTGFVIASADRHKPAIAGLRPPFSDEIVKIYLDSTPSSPHLERLCDARSDPYLAAQPRCALPDGGIWAVPHASPSRDGTRVVWGSTWGATSSPCAPATYVMDISNKGRNPALIDQPVNTWVRLDPTVKRYDGTDEPNGFPKMQFSRSVFAPEYGAIIHWGGGGHGAARVGNDVWLYDTAKNEWRQETPGDPLSSYPNPGLEFPTLGQYCNNDTSYTFAPPWSSCVPGSEYSPIGSTASGAPWTSEIYGQRAWDSYNRRYVMYGPNYITGAMVEPAFVAPASFAFDPFSKRWTFLANDPHLYSQAGVLEFDPVARKMLAANHTWWTRPGYSDMPHQRWWLDVTTDTWTQCPGDGNGGPQPAIYNQDLVYDAASRKMYSYGAEFPNTSDLYSYDLTTDSWEHLHPTPDPVYGIPPAAAPSAAISPKDHVMLLFGWGGTSEQPADTPVPLWAYHIDTNAWTKIQPPPGGWVEDPYVPGRTLLLTWVTLVYDPTNNVFLLLRTKDVPENTIGGWDKSMVGEIWSYKYSAGDGAGSVVAAARGSSTQSVPRLAQNSPNPFHSETSIQYRVPGRGRATLRVFDIHGRLVETLVDRVMDAGDYAATWNGQNRLGHLVGSGVYFCELETSTGFRATRRMVRLK
jgi:hypothetical protein